MAVANRPKHSPERRVIVAVADAKRFVDRATFAPDTTTNPIDVIRELLSIIDPRLTHDERRAIAVSLA